ncbi:NUDIX domain-containing protein [Actinomadura terrae]|uniref:NUDIX domain-containing protein n=1 Tax=Actinomadura terrae TaxID=604353 RepID=UPI001FA73EF2|nr:NUDIX domain-containing protein [Actinomadura terrae]
MSSAAGNARRIVRDLLTRVTPGDGQEAADQRRTLDWVDSGAPLFRVRKPDVPPRHLAVYAALLDEPTRSVMVVAHRLAQAWLFPGGHVDDNEDPRRAITRELAEELRIRPQFHSAFGDDPFFLTVTQTRGDHSHTDVTMWFVFQADRDGRVTTDPREFGDVRWAPVDDRGSWPDGATDPGMDRFLRKLGSVRGGASR